MVLFRRLDIIEKESWRLTELQLRSEEEKQRIVAEKIARVKAECETAMVLSPCMLQSMHAPTLHSALLKNCLQTVSFL